MNRRDFVRGPGLGFVVTLVAAAVAGPLHGSVHQVQVRGSRDGRLLRSEDGGESWEEAVVFGPGFTVGEVWRHRAGHVARVGFGGRSFLLHSTDGRAWKSFPNAAT